jgi:hypothetical protein
MDAIGAVDLFSDYVTDSRPSGAVDRAGRIEHGSASRD